MAYPVAASTITPDSFSEGSFQTSIPTYTRTSTSTPTEATPNLVSVRSPSPTDTTSGATSTATRVPIVWDKCPKEDPKLTPNLDISLSAYYPDIEVPILIYLNKGVTRHVLLEAFKKYDSTYDDQHYLEKDLTGDNIPELVIAYGPLFVFGCQENNYRTMLAVGTNNVNLNDVDPWIEAIRDLNTDGIPELVVVRIFAPFTWVNIYEWDGWQFQNLIEPSPEDSYITDNVAQMTGAKVSIKQSEDGISELILEGGIPAHFSLYFDGYPWRKETKIYRWNGKSFTFYRRDFDPPDYRFQAVQDGDRESLMREYDKALAFYQDAIFNDKLDWWTQRRKDYKFACWGWPDCPTPTPPVPTPDPNEYNNLSGYARFRIMLLHVVRGYLPEAQTVYDTLQLKYPKGQIGNAYAEMADAFWKEYQTSNNIDKACNSAIKYASKHPKDILAYLGNGDNAVAYFGKQSLVYHPEDVCPFK